MSCPCPCPAVCAEERDCMREVPGIDPWPSRARAARPRASNN
jgi:hypothetical protein